MIEVVEKVGEVDYKIRVTPDKIKTYHINMLKKYHQQRSRELKMTMNLEIPVSQK